MLPNKLNRRMKLARYPGLFARLRYNSNMIPAAYIGAPTPAQLKRPFKHPEPRFRGDGLNITKLRGPARRRNPKANPEKEMQMKWINDNYGDEPATGAKHKVKLKYKRKAAWEKAEKKADEPEPEGEQAQQGPKHRSPGYAKKKAARR